MARRKANTLEFTRTCMACDKNDPTSSTTQVTLKGNYKQQYEPGVLDIPLVPFSRCSHCNTWLCARCIRHQDECHINIIQTREQ